MGEAEGFRKSSVFCFVHVFFGPLTCALCGKAHFWPLCRLTGKARSGARFSTQLRIAQAMRSAVAFNKFADYLFHVIVFCTSLY
nr:hypothetical protein Iba_chr03aCG6440 [Ipomoea batatas]GMD64235.1 hypothetical protein Iba_scaffold49263CG0020 [Ipomoea batatas]GME02262.1 hypothetical protein Iba_scaffold1681350CG0010 [Ipomoea batatas]